MSDRVLMLVQAEPPITGRVGEALVRRGYRLELCNPIAGAALPARPADYAAVVIFGGPMSVNDEAELPGIGAQIRWIPRLLEAGVPLLGICLGAQLLARSLGARVGPHPGGMAEIGYYPIRPTSAGADLFPEPLSVYQWHLEGFELPAAATPLARGEVFPNQAFRVDGNAYGIQFHPEVTAPIMEDWMQRAAHRLSLPGAQEPAQQRRGHRDHDARLGRWLEHFLDRWLAQGPG